MARSTRIVILIKNIYTLWGLNGCFFRLGEAGQLFSGDSGKQWTTAVLTANVRFLLLMLAAQQYEEDIRRSRSRFYNRAFTFPNL